MGIMDERLRKTAEETNRIHKENYPTEPGNTPPAPTPPVPDSQPPIPPVTVQPPQPTPTPPTPPTPPPPPAEPDWKHKFEVLEGKYRKEIGDANAMAARAMNELAEVKIQMANLARPPQPPTPPADQGFTLKPEELATIESFKKEYPDMMKDGFEPTVRYYVYQAVEEAMKRYLPQLSKIDKIEEVEQRVARKEDFDFKATLGQLVPDWGIINTDPEFLNYLNGNVEKYTGATYWQLLQAAHQRGDVHVVAEIFNSFKALSGKGQPSPTPPAPPVSPPAPAPTASAPNLPPNLAPPKPSSGYPVVEGHVAANPSNKRIFTADQVRTFYNDIAKGKYAGREADVKSLEAEINLASVEGRIQR